MKCLALLPARGGSKRIPRKNIKEFCGKPIIAWTIETALRSMLFDEVMVSTDDEEIAAIAKKYGANVPFLRSAQNSNDTAGTEEVILEVLSEYKKLNLNFDAACCIYPASPLITDKKLSEGLKRLKEGNYDTIFSVIKYSHPVQRALRVQNEKIKLVWPENRDCRTQDLETYFHDSGQYYWMNVEQFLVQKQLFTNNTGFIELSEMEAQDIDNESDWALAELKFKKLHSLASQ